MKDECEKVRFSQKHANDFKVKGKSNAELMLAMQDLEEMLKQDIKECQFAK